MKDAVNLINALGLTSPQKNNFRLAVATVDPNYSGTGRPCLQFAGESVGTRQYPYLASYTPAANDRVLVALLTHSGCILGKIV